MTDWMTSWAPTHPVRWSPSSGTDPDRWIPLETAVDRLARDYPDETRNAERTRIQAQLQAGRTLSTGWATYRLESAP